MFARKSVYFLIVLSDFIPPGSAAAFLISFHTLFAFELLAPISPPRLDAPPEVTLLKNLLMLNRLDFTYFPLFGSGAIPKR